MRISDWSSDVCSSDLLAAEAPSPSFTLVQSYAPPEVRLPVWHVDLYRLSHPEEAEELGLDEALSEGALPTECPEWLGSWRWPDALVFRLTGAGGVCRGVS